MDSSNPARMDQSDLNLKRKRESKTEDRREQEEDTKDRAEPVEWLGSGMHSLEELETLAEHQADKLIIRFENNRDKTCAQARVERIPGVPGMFVIRKFLTQDEQLAYYNELLGKTYMVMEAKNRYLKTAIPVKRLKFYEADFGKTPYFALDQTERDKLAEERDAHDDAADAKMQDANNDGGPGADAKASEASVVYEPIYPYIADYIHEVAGDMSLCTKDLQGRLWRFLGAATNTCVGNAYRGGLPPSKDDRIVAHNDKMVAAALECSHIFTLSTADEAHPRGRPCDIGDMGDKEGKHAKVLARVNLQPGDLLAITGAANEFLTHSIPPVNVTWRKKHLGKRDADIGTRISLTMRCMATYRQWDTRALAEYRKQVAEIERKRLAGADSSSSPSSSSSSSSSSSKATGVAVSDVKAASTTTNKKAKKPAKEVVIIQDANPELKSILELSATDVVASHEYIVPDDGTPHGKRVSGLDQMQKWLRRELSRRNKQISALREDWAARQAEEEAEKQDVAEPPAKRAKSS